MQITCAAHTWTAPDGQSFPFSEWLPREGNPRAVVIAIHGLSGAALDFEPLGHRLATVGIVTVAPELRGQGNDPHPEQRGDLRALDDWYRDLSAFFALTRRRYPGLPFICYGESMGGALLVRFLAQARGDELPLGLILASAVVSLPNRPVWWQEMLFRFFLLVRPGHRIDVRKLAKPKKGETPKWVTRDEAHRAWFETAPHKIDAFTVRFFKCLLELISGCCEAAAKIEIPVLVLYAAHDVFITSARVEEFFGLLGSRDKQLQLYPEAYHLLLHDHDKEEVLNRVQEWVGHLHDA